MTDEHEQDLKPDEERALGAIVEHGTEAEIDPDAARALARRGLVEQGGAPDAPTFTASDAGRALVAQWQEEMDAYMAGRVIFQHVLLDDHPGGEWTTRAALLAEVADLPAAVVEAELGRLVEAGVVVVEGERVKASACARYINDLNMIGV